jgi:hypothetical protein
LTKVMATVMVTGMAITMATGAVRDGIRSPAA